jgi:hypothetical protein
MVVSHGITSAPAFPDELQAFRELPATSAAANSAPATPTPANTEEDDIWDPLVISYRD